MTIDDIKHLLKNQQVFDWLKEIEIITEDERFCTVDGILYSKNKRRLYFCPRRKDSTLVIPDGRTQSLKIPAVAATFPR